MPWPLGRAGRAARSAWIVGVVVGLRGQSPEFPGPHVAMAMAAQVTPEKAPGTPVPRSAETSTAPDRPASPTTSKPGQPPQTSDKPKAAATNPATSRPGTIEKLNELRTETAKRLEALKAEAAAADAPAKPGAPPAKAPEDTKPLREILEARLEWMDKYKEAEKELRLATLAKPDEEKAAAKAKLDKLNALLGEAAKTPNVLLPQIFQSVQSEVADEVRNEMKDIIEATQNELKDWATKLDAAKGEVSKIPEVRAAMRAEREKIFQNAAAAEARAGEKAAATKTAKSPTPERRILEQERKLNLDWETQVESLRLMAQEAKITLEAKTAAVRELEVQVCEAQVKVATRKLEEMSGRLRAVTDLQQRDLKRAAATEEKKAAKSEDLLERYRAQRSAELLEMEAQTVKFEQILTANPSPSAEDQKVLADKAKQVFEDLKRLLKDGEVSRLDATLLNNEFRRIGPERDRIARNEMSTIEARVQFYGNALTEAELELIEDAHKDQFEHEALLERLPVSRRAEADKVFQEIEKKHRVILERRRDTLRKLANSAADALREVAARLAILEEEYIFIRTNIFWVRDQEPIGPETLGQGGVEIARLGRAIFRLAEEAADMRNWNRASAEFVAAASGLFVLPLGLFKVRRKLKRRIAIDLPHPSPTPEPTDPAPASDPAGSVPGCPEPD